MKRCFSLLLATALVLSLFPSMAVHAHGEVHTEPEAWNASDTTEAEVKDCANFEEALKYLRDILKRRVSGVTIKMPIEEYQGAYLEELYLTVVKDSSSYRGDDSIRWQTAAYDCYAEVEAAYVYLHYSFLYLSTGQEEAELDAAIDVLLAELACDPEDDYGTVKKVYDWVCSNVTYVDDDGASVHDFTPYGAMINRRGTSRGVSLLVYQIMQKLGIECRVIYGSSYGKEHFWNMVRIEAVSSLRYYLDAAWDAGQSEYRWFLKGTDRFSDHINDPEYLPENFYDVKFIEKEDYALTKNYCDLYGHSWKEGSCAEEISCYNCGIKKGEFGPHDWNNISKNCGRARVCGICGEFIPPQPHVYTDEWDTECDECYCDRELLCVGATGRIIVDSWIENDEPLWILSPGMTLTLVEEKQIENIHEWVYEVTLAGIGDYTADVRFLSGLKEDSYGFSVYGHSYSIYTGQCVRCDQMREDGHVHNWKYATCSEPMTCTACGETYGEPSEHAFVTRNCGLEPAVCHICGFTTDGPPGHSYYSDTSNSCYKCSTERIIGCTEGGAFFAMPGAKLSDFRLVESDPRVFIVAQKEPASGQISCCEFELAATEPGRYEVIFESELMDGRNDYTLEVRPHSFTAGKCDYCGKTEDGIHFHKMQYATCTEPQTCTECGETSGKPLGHKAESGPCNEPRPCSRCGVVVENLGHSNGSQSGKLCAYCGRYPYTLCQGQGLSLLLSSDKGGDFSLVGDSAGCTLVLMEYFVVKAVHYWEYVLYTPGPGSYEVDLAQKKSEESMGLAIDVLPHETFEGICIRCGIPEDTHTHTWKSATCSRSATCTDCYETKGTPLNHDFSKYACSEYAKCARCGEARGKVSHTYDGDGDKYCNVCNRLKISGCEDDTLIIELVGESSDGFILKEAPKGVYIQAKSYYVGLDGIRHGYEIFTPGSGTYELVMQDAHSGELFRFTVQRYRHKFEDGYCFYCGKNDGTGHFHDWVDATCDTPAYCKTCGEILSEVMGHEFWGPTCTEPRSCRCGLVEAEPLGHDYMVWSCTEPGVCRRCNDLQKEAGGHSYDGDSDMYCNRCDQLRVIGCVDGALTVQFTSEQNTPYILSDARSGVALIRESCELKDGLYIHTYRLNASGTGSYELTAVQDGNEIQETFTLQIMSHLYEDGFCCFCGAEWKGLLGDVDGNGILNYNDALLILRASIGLETLDEAQMALADVNEDGKRDYSDALKVLRISIGLT